MLLIIVDSFFGRIRLQAPWSEQSVFDVTMNWSNYGFPKLRHRDVKKALLAPWSAKTNAVFVFRIYPNHK